MASNKKSRRPHAGNTNRVVWGRVGCSVPMTVATNPVARAIERANTERAAAHMETRILTAVDRSRQERLIDDCIQTVGMAMLSSAKSWELEHDVQAVLLAAVDALTLMGLDSQRWHAEHAGLVAEAVAIAAPVLLAVSPADRVAGAREIDALVDLAEQRARESA